MICPHDPDLAPPGRAHILVLDEDADFRLALAEILRDDGHEVTECATAAQLPPLATLGRVTCAVIHYRMSGGDGIAFADEFHALHPQAILVVTTAYSTPLLEAEVAARPYVRLLAKPFDYATLLTLLHS